MDVCSVIQQRALASAAQLTESYISQLLTRKKAPPAANRTGIYEKMNAFLKLPKGQLTAMVEAQSREEQTHERCKARFLNLRAQIPILCYSLNALNAFGCVVRSLRFNDLI